MEEILASQSYLDYLQSEDGKQNFGNQVILIFFNTIINFDGLNVE